MVVSTRTRTDLGSVKLDLLFRLRHTRPRLTFVFTDELFFIFNNVVMGTSCVAVCLFRSGRVARLHLTEPSNRKVSSSSSTPLTPLYDDVMLFA